ncbi:PH domain-containing protein [Streptomyces sp. JJ36]|nr:PH domain-containing protein [Streptomyces sp. JJ36]
MTGGVLLLALALWLVSDAVLNGTGRTPWAALSGLLLFTPLVVAYTLRPAVFASRRRIRVRNPLRTITVPWPAVESVQAGYSSELIAEGRKFQLWAIPVSLRQRKSVQRHNARVRAGHAPSSSGFLGFGKTLPSDADRKEKRAPSDQAIDELRGLALAHGEDGESPAEPGPVEVRWAYEILVPALAGAAAVTFFLTTG